jgi:hypothetical protein
MTANTLSALDLIRLLSGLRLVIDDPIAAQHLAAAQRRLTVLHDDRLMRNRAPTTH